MDFQHILKLIAAISGEPGDEFAALKAGGGNPNAPVAQIACPQPLPVSEIEGRTIFCGTVQVSEDNAKPDGKKISLAFTILKSWSSYPEPDPLVYLEGGPGGSALTMIPLLDRVYAPWRATRDIVFWDQRSAGISGHSVNCYNALSSNAVKIAKGQAGSTTTDGQAKPDTTMAECLREIESSGIDITKYNTTENARDVRTIMTALGYSTYNLYGISYGTKLALETMRVAPEGIRSVIIDGVAPSWVNLYNSFALKTDEVIDYVVQQCKADDACNKAFPELEKVINETLEKAAQGKLVYKGEVAPTAVVTAPFNSRNGKYDSTPITRFIPAYVYELHRGKETPTVDMLAAAGFDLPKAGEKEIAAASKTLPPRQRDLIRTLSDNTAIAAKVERSTVNVMGELRSALDEKSGVGPVASLFDQELEQSILAIRETSPEKVEAIIADYIVLQNEAPSKPALKVFVGKHFDGDAELRLQSLIDSMNEMEVKGSFAIIKRDSYKAEAGFLSAMYLSNYACQEDVPFNTLEGYRKANEALKYPLVANEYESLATSFFKTCEAFKPQPREFWHTPVDSDIPTLTIGSLFDIQTPASWAKVAAEKLTNAQVFMIPEAGHGAVLYQPCVADMGVAFVNNPNRKLSDACVGSIKIPWHIPDWAKTAK